MPGYGLPNCYVRSVGRFAAFTWQYARGSGRNYNLAYNSVTTNTTTVQISAPINLGYNSGNDETSFGGYAIKGKLLGLPSNLLMTYYDTNGNKFTIKTKQILKHGTGE